MTMEALELRLRTLERRDAGRMLFVLLAELEVFNPKVAKGLFSAGVVEYTEGIKFIPKIELNQREAKSMTTVDPSGLGVVVKIERFHARRPFRSARTKTIRQCSISVACSNFSSSALSQSPTNRDLK